MLSVVVVVVAVVVGFVEADSGCFPFDLDEIEVKFGDAGSPFGYQANYISNCAERRKGYINSPAIQIRAKLDEGYRCTAYWVRN